MSDKPNHPLGQPSAPSSSPLSLIVDYINFDNKNVPIYWGPEQDTTEGYDVPLLNSWRSNTLLRIPNIGRFFFYSSSIDSDDYKTKSPPSPPPPLRNTSYCKLVDVKKLYDYPNGCTVYSIYWKIMVRQINGTEIPCNPTSTYDYAYTCQTNGSANDTDCLCRPECNGFGFSPTYPTTDACGCSNYGASPVGLCTNCPKCPS